MSNLGVHPIRVGAPGLHQYRVHNGAEQAPCCEKCPRGDGPFHEVCPRSGDEGSDCQTVAKVFYEHFIVVLQAPMRLLSNRGVNITSAIVGSCVSPSVSRSAEPQPTMLSVMDRWNISTKCYST